MPTRRQPFQAKRPQTQIDMILIERSALLVLASVGKAMLTLRQKDNAPISLESNAIEGAVRLAEGALNAQG